MDAAIVEFTSYPESVRIALDEINAHEILAQQSAILIKPNLVNSSPHPVTTSVECCSAVIQYVQSCSKAAIVIAEGCGDNTCETDEIFKKLGYTDMANHLRVQLIDLNQAPLRELKNTDSSLFPKMYLPEIAFSHFIFSLPVLKAHTLATITGTRKNMMGFAPPKYFSGKSGVWKKAAFHAHIHKAITELNRYRSPDLSLLDASIGLAEHHLGGPPCSPPANKIIASFNPVEVDRHAAQMLGCNWKKIPHLL